MTINTKSILSHLSTNLSEQYQSFIRINAHLQNDMEKGLVSAKETTSLVESSLGMLVKGMAQIDHIQKTQLEILDNMADLTSLTTSISRVNMD